MYKPIIKNEMTDLLVKAIISLNNDEDVYRFLEDICTVKEIKELSLRITVAKLLSEKETYTEIVDKTKASSATISRVNRALTYGSDGYNSILNKINKNN